MSTIEKFEQQLFTLFDSVSLDELNHKASMLTRLDNKYVVQAPVLEQLLARLARHFDVLDIAGKRLFTYDTCYFDDEQLSCYFSHHNGRRQRIKVRTRNYQDAGLCFIEAKIKDIRGVTVKKRLPYTPEKHGTLNNDARNFITQLYRDFYQKDFSQQLEPQLNMRYKRITLVAKDGRERMTIDTDIRFFKDGCEFALSQQVFIVETKSRNANGLADAILRSYHQHPSNKCSKYCLGLCVTQQVGRINNFMPVLRKLGVLASSASMARRLQFEPETPYSIPQPMVSAL